MEASPPSRQERRAVARAVKKKRRIALTVPNVLSALEGLEEEKWWSGPNEWHLGSYLGMPDSKLEQIWKEYSTHLERYTAFIKYFLEFNPGASWRALVTVLDWMGETAMADKLRPHCEPLTDPTLTVVNVVAVLEAVEDWCTVGFDIGVPIPVRDRIKANYPNDGECKAAMAEYFLSTVAGASWASVASALYYREETAALKTVGKHLKEIKDPSLTLHNILAVCEGVTDWYWLGAEMHVPKYTRSDILRQNDTDSERLEALMQTWLTTYPVPSWRLLAQVLNDYKEHTALRRLFEQYLERPPDARILSALHEEMTEKGSRGTLQSILVGLPHSGKSSLHDRLLGRPAREQSTTGTAEMARVEIHVTQDSGSNWKTMSNGDDDGTNLVGEVLEEAKDYDPTNEDTDTLPIFTDPTPGQTAMKLATSYDIPEQSPRTPNEGTPSTRDESTPMLDPLQISEYAHTEAFHKVAKDVTNDSFTLFLLDSRGVLGFEGLLRCVLSGPTLLIITFRLDKDLNNQYTVEYQQSDGSVTALYETSFTIKDTILQLLAIISSVGSLTKKDDESQFLLRPKVLFVGTHFDKLASRELYLAIDQKLQELIKTTDAYHKCMIEFASKGRLILPINNLSGDDDDVREIRAAIECIGRRGGD